MFRGSYDEITALSNKPLMIAETASTETGGNKADWIRSAFLTEMPTRFPRIASVIWFNSNKETNWRLDSSTAANESYREVARDPLYKGRLP